MILVFGQSGQVARELARFEGVTTFGRKDADLSDPQACAQIVSRGEWRAVINAAAYTAVDKAESEEASAMTINGEAPKAIAMECARKGIPMVQISTDYVFPGDGKAPWQPNDMRAPLNAYGRSKLAGENAVIASGAIYAILRVSWVFSSSGNNFVKTMLRFGAEREELNIVADQIGGPTPARAVASACYKIAESLIADPWKSGIYHLSGSPDTSWADFAREIFHQSGLLCRVNDIATSEYPTPARRPLNSRMSSETIKNIFNIDRPDWRVALAEVLKEMNAT